MTTLPDSPTTKPQAPPCDDRDLSMAIAEWHDAPAGSEIAKLQLHEYLGMTWDEYKAWAESGGDA